jgi:hypothetical protein
MATTNFSSGIIVSSDWLNDADSVVYEKAVYITPLQYGAVGDGTTDDTAAVRLCFAAATSGSVIDLCGKTYAMYNSVTAVSSGDAIALASLPRLYNISNVTVRNGKLIAASPGVNGSTQRFPSTLVVDGCTNIRFENVTAVAKGESYGDADSSSGLSAALRRDFLGQNGGHACVIIRSNKVQFDSCRFERAGSTAAFYASSSDNVVLNDSYASAQSLGYAGFAIDSWCGAVATSGFTAHRMYLNNCRSDNNGDTYGSKCCVCTEDTDCTVYVSGGVFKDSYANGADKYLGAAFQVADSTMYVNGALVDNCAAIGLTFNSAASTATLRVSNTAGFNLRTSGHIIGANSFGTSDVTYQSAQFRVVGTSLWSGVDGLSSSTIIANLKPSSTAYVDLIDCIGVGPTYLSWNPVACYGGLRIIGGDYEIFHKIILSKGWGGSAASTKRGFEFQGGAHFSLTITPSTDPIVDVTNRDASLVDTYIYYNMDPSCAVESAAFRVVETLSDVAGTLTERTDSHGQYVSCCTLYNSTARPSTLRVVSKDGVVGSNYRLTVAYPQNFATLGTIVDDVAVSRKILSYNSAAAVASGELRAQIDVSGTTTDFTVDGTYGILGR